MANFGPLTAEIGSGVWGTPANFNGFLVLPSLLQRRRSPEANRTLHDVWPSLGLVHYIYIFGGSCPLTEFCPVQYSLYVQGLRSFNFKRRCLYIGLHVCSRIITFTSLSHRSLCYQLTQSSSATGEEPIYSAGNTGSVTARHSTAGVSQILRRGTRNGITELSQRAPPIFGLAAITLGIDPHCRPSCSSVLCTFRKQKMTSVLADSKVSDVKVT